MLEAYFDESERTAGTFCVAGYVFAKQQAKKFAKEWSRLFAGIEGGLHMVDLAHGKESFEGMQPSEKKKLLVEAVRIISLRMSFAVAVSCKLEEMKRYSPAWICGFGHAYPVCCHLAMTTVGQCLDEKNNPEKVAYFFENGHQYEGEARKFMKNAVRVDLLKQSYRYYSDSFVPKADAVALQAADFLAYEWAKCHDETVEREIRPVRESFRAMVKSAPGRYKVRHVTGTPLVKFMNRVSSLGLSQIAENGPVTAL